MKTRNGIFYDLSISDYIYRTERITFYFSSELYLNKFRENKEKHLRAIEQQLTNKFKFTVRFDDAALIQLYMKIEKRGFRILIDEVVYKCREQVTLDGEMRI